MTNVATLYTLETQIPYQPHGFEDWLREVKRAVAQNEELGDGLSLYHSNALTTTAVAVKASAGKVYGVVVKSNGTAGGVQLWNTAQGGVTVGTDANDLWVPVSATSGEITCVRLTGSSLATTWNTAITAAATTTSRGNTAMSNLPEVWILYA